MVGSPEGKNVIKESSSFYLPALTSLAVAFILGISRWGGGGCAVYQACSFLSVFYDVLRS